MTTATAHLPDYDWPGMNANTNLHRLREPRARLVQGRKNLQPGADGAGRIVFMCGGITKVHQQPIAQILGDITLLAFNDLGAHFLIGPYDRLQVFRVELLGQGSRTDQVTEHHRQLAPFAFWRFPLRLG